MKPHAPDWLLQRLDRPVAVFGAGVSGRAAAELITALGGTAVVYDQAAGEPERTRFGAQESSRHSLVVVSPGFAPTHEWVAAAEAGGCEVITELDLGALAWPGEIIAVTGTNGKTTITEFLAHALRSIGRDARVVGNIGVAFSDAWKLPATSASIAVCEVSSFQAEQLRYFESCASLWSNFAEDHLERHPTMEAYFRAKYRLVERTRDKRVFYGPSVRTFADDFRLELPSAGAVNFDDSAVAPALAGTLFERLPQRENFLLVRALWLSRGLREEALLAAARSFAAGPHRLARVRDLDGVTYWNDSKATNFHATEAALAGFAQPVLWIGGGRSKGGDVESFITRIASQVRKAFVLGETGVELARGLRKLAVPVTPCASLDEAVGCARAAASAGDHVLLSPGFSSFDMFNGYGDRGRRFEAIVAGLSSSKSGPSVSSQSQSSNRSARPGLCLL